MEWIRSDLVENAVPGPHISDETEEDHPAWIRIKAMHDHGDFDKIDRMVKVLEGLEALGSMGSILAKFLMWAQSSAGPIWRSPDISRNG